MEKLPNHLKKYVVEQNYEKYTPVDQAVWRFIMRQLKSFLSTHAHECYLEGLEKTGVEIESIPKIEEISKKLEKFGWRALPVSGFIPPAAFMELQSLSVLPIASDIRTLDHLLYTPAPDIVHEAAGHAPILVNPEFANYLKQYAQVAKKAIISKEDLDLYEAIRQLSDIKENPESTSEQIKMAEEHLAKVSHSMSHISEASLLGRMNWWTAEYGLIGDIDKPKIFGAGLLSSVGESRWCLSDKVKKIPLTVDCIKTSYDITEPQPQLFVTPDFKTLVKVLDDLAEQMAFRQGGVIGVEKAIQAKSVNTVELNSGIQISGQATEVLCDANKQVAYLCFTGPSQLSIDNTQINGHGKDYHAHGFGTAIGYLKQFPKICPAKLNTQQWQEIGLNFTMGETVRLEFTSGLVITGKYQSHLQQNGKTVVLSLGDAKAHLQDRVLFKPEWGIYDIALGSSITSVFAGPADREAYGETEDFIAARVPQPRLSENEKFRHRMYSDVRLLRENRTQGQNLEDSLQKIVADMVANFPTDWLLFLEVYELCLQSLPHSDLKNKVHKILQEIAANKKYNNIIHDGIALAHII